MNPDTIRTKLVIRYQDNPASAAKPPSETKPALLPGDRVICVETVKDAFGYATARVWIASDERQAS